MKAFKSILPGFLFFVLFQSNPLFGQLAIQSSLATTTLPKVFVLGEETTDYEKIAPEYKSLLEACDNDMEAAFKKWLSMLLEMEAYAGEIDFELKGVKLWMQVFWSKNGTVEHIGFYLRPTSRNVEIEDMRAFFSSFMNHYSFPLSSKFKYSHYTSVSFPTYFNQMVGAKRISGDTAKNAGSGND